MDKLRHGEVKSLVWGYSGRECDTGLPYFVHDAYLILFHSHNNPTKEPVLSNFTGRKLKFKFLSLVSTGARKVPHSAATSVFFLLDLQPPHFLKGANHGIKKESLSLWGLNPDLLRTSVLWGEILYCSFSDSPRRSVIGNTVPIINLNTQGQMKLKSRCLNRTCLWLCCLFVWSTSFKPES